jgi:hypothetical protein
MGFPWKGKYIPELQAAKGGRCTSLSVTCAVSPLILYVGIKEVDLQ